VELIGVCKDLHPFPYGIVAGGHKTGPATVIEFNGAQAAHAGRLQGIVVAKGGDLNPVFFGNLKDILSFFSLNFFAVKFESNHRFYLFRIFDWKYFSISV
jgi:hypothetical protein